MKVKSEQEMIEYGRKLGSDFLRRLKWGETVVVELTGDVGAGKTTLTRGVAEGLGVATPVTSPSFTISKRYAFPIDGNDASDSCAWGDDKNAKFGQLIHYDFYRLSDPGLMSEELSEALAEPKTVIILEWSNSVEDILPEDRMKIEILYQDDGSREIR